MSFVPDFPIVPAFGPATMVLAITPGADMAFQMSRAINCGHAHGVAAMFAAMAGILVHTTLVVLGSAVLIVAAPPGPFTSFGWPRDHPG